MASDEQRFTVWINAYNTSFSQGSTVEVATSTATAALRAFEEAMSSSTETV